MEGIKIDRLTAYSDKEEVLKDVSISIEAGKAYALLGESDRAKRVLLRLASKYHEEKSVYIESDAMPENISGRERKLLSLRPFGFMRVEEYFYYLHGGRGADRRNECNRCLELAALASKRKARISKLSLTELKLMNIAVELKNQPLCVIIDADDLTVEKQARVLLNRCISNLKGQGIAVLVAMDVRHVGDSIDTVGVLHQGRLLAEGSPREVSMLNSQSVYSIKSSLSVKALKEKFAELKEAESIEVSGRSISIFTKNEDAASADILRICSDNKVTVKKLSLRVPTLSESVGRLIGECAK